MKIRKSASISSGINHRVCCSDNSHNLYYVKSLKLPKCSRTPVHATKFVPSSCVKLFQLFVGNNKQLKLPHTDSLPRLLCGIDKVQFEVAELFGDRLGRRRLLIVDIELAARSSRHLNRLEKLARRKFEATHEDVCHHCPRGLNKRVMQSLLQLGWIETGNISCPLVPPVTGRRGWRPP